MKSKDNYQYDENNANAGTDRGRKMVRESLEQFGAGRSILIDKNGKVIAGNKTLEQARALGLDIVEVSTQGDQLVVVRRDDLDLDADAKARGMAYADNRAGEVGLAWDADVIASDIDAGVFPENLFEDYELEEIGINLGNVEEQPAPEPQIDRAEELREKWKTEQGQLWVIPSEHGGDHRLLCGDSTNADDVARLMGDNVAEICFTSPPYSDLRDYKEGVDVSIDVIKKFISVAVNNAKYFVVNLGIKLSDFEVIPYWDTYIQEAHDNNLKLLAWNVWDKLQVGSVGSQMQMFGLCHEWLFVFGKQPKKLNRTIPNETELTERKRRNRKGNKVRQKDGTTQYTTNGEIFTHKQLMSVVSCVPHVGNDLSRKSHPAVMSIDLPIEYIDAMTNQREIIYEPFAGSGTTIAACETVKRLSYAIEYSPAYCAVILERMSDMGLKPRLSE